MAKVVTDDTNYKNIADAIRLKNGQTAVMKPAEMADLIKAIETGGDDTGPAIVDRSITSFKNSDITNVGDYAFYQCSSLTNADLPNTMSIGGYAFCQCKSLTDIDLPNVTSVGRYTFGSCSNLSKVDLPEVTIVNQHAFEYCGKLSKVNLPNVTKIDSYAFYSCSVLNNVDLPNVTSLGDGAFNDCRNLSNINLPNIRAIPYQCFGYCSRLSKITLPSVKSIGNSAFYYCTSLSLIRLPHDELASLDNTNAFFNCKKLSRIEVNSRFYEKYCNATNWSAYKDEIFPIRDAELTEFVIDHSDSVNIYYNTETIQLWYNQNDDALDTERGVIWSVDGPATISEDGVLTFTEDAKDGDTITVKAVSTYNSEITAEKTMSCIYLEPYITIDGNDGQWVDTGTQIDGAEVYKSDAGSYHIGGGKSVARIKFAGYKKLTVYTRSYGYSSYNYTEIGAIDTEVSRNAMTNALSTSNKSSATQYYNYTFENDGLEHFVEVIYSKYTYNYGYNDDRGYFYVKGE